jgi:PIN domain nuclease of toxin-antitoxin system
MNRIGILEIRVDHLVAVCNLPFHHRDPFDRLMIAQASVEGLSIISTDSVLDKYDVQREW